MSLTVNISAILFIFIPIKTCRGIVTDVDFRRKKTQDFSVSMVLVVMRKLDAKAPVLVLGWGLGELDLVTTAGLFMSIPSRSKL